MAKFAKKETKFGIMDNIPTPTDEHTHTHNDSDVYVQDVKVKETKTKRIQILTYSNLVRRMDAYGKRNGLSRAEVFEKAVSEFLDNN
jgi:hypothetical protein